MRLHCLPFAKCAKKVRRGRGESSGLGKTAGRGNKGARSRSGYHVSPVTSGIPWYRKLPIRGFTSPRAASKVLRPVSLERIGKLMEDGAARIDAHFLAKNGLIRSPSVRYKIVGAAADLRPALFEANAFSASAKSTICKCGGEQRVVAMAAAGSGGLTATPPCEDIK